DFEAVHETACAADPESHAGRRSVAAGEDRVEMRDAWAAVAHAHDELLRRAVGIDEELDLAVLGVAAGVAHDLRDRCRDARLLDGLAAEERRDVSGALPRQDGLRDLQKTPAPSAELANGTCPRYRGIVAATVSDIGG